MQIFALLHRHQSPDGSMRACSDHGLQAGFSFLLSAPVIFAAGVFKLHDLTGPLGDGIRTQYVFGSVLSGSALTSRCGSWSATSVTPRAR